MPRVRRPTFTPDGAYLITPTGIHRPPVEKSSSNNSSNSSNKDNSSGNKTCSSTSTGRSSNSYCTHMFARNNLTSPCVSLTGLDEPSVAVRCLPRPYKLLPHQKSSSASSPCCPADIGAGAGADSNADGVIPAAESAASESRKDIVSMIPGDFRYEATDASTLVHFYVDRSSFISTTCGWLLLCVVVTTT